MPTSSHAVAVNTVTDGSTRNYGLSANMPSAIQLIPSGIEGRQDHFDLDSLSNTPQNSPQLDHNCRDVFWSSTHGLDRLVPYFPRPYDVFNAYTTGERYALWAPLLTICSLIKSLTLDLRNVTQHVRDGTSLCTLSDLLVVSIQPYPFGMFFSLARLSLVLGRDCDVTLLLPFMMSTLEEVNVTFDIHDAIPSSENITIFLTLLPQYCPIIQRLCVQGTLTEWQSQRALVYAINRLPRITDLHLLFPGLLVLPLVIGFRLRRLQIYVASEPINLNDLVYLSTLQILHLLGEAEQIVERLMTLHLPNLLQLHAEATEFRTSQALGNLSAQIARYTSIKEVKIEYHNGYRRRGVVIPPEVFAPLSNCRTLQRLSITGHDCGTNGLGWTPDGLVGLVKGLDQLWRLELRASPSRAPNSPAPTPVCTLPSVAVLVACKKLKTLVIGVDMTTVSMYDLPTGSDLASFGLEMLVLDESSRCLPDRAVLMFIERTWPNVRLSCTPRARAELVELCGVYNKWTLRKERPKHLYRIRTLEEHLSITSRGIPSAEDDETGYDHA